MKKILKKINTIKKHKEPLYAILAALVIIITITTYTPGHLLHNKIRASELSFTETSSNKQIKGSVTPASCESYPTMTIYHYTGDMNGHCAGTCPSGSSLVTRNWWKQCAYSVNLGEGNFSYLNKTYAPNDTCPLEYLNPANGVTYYNDSATLIPATVCATTCADGSEIYPHKGQSCPSTPPTVNLWFN